MVQRLAIVAFSSCSFCTAADIDLRTRGMSTATETSFSFPSAVRGYHVYKDVWAATEGEVLPCSRELHNLRDPYAVAIKKGSTIVGHVPRTISAVCSMFMRRDGTISCRVTGSRRYSSDLPQGGLEIPCAS